MGNRKKSDVSDNGAPRGQINYLAGLGAEDMVARYYEDKGHRVLLKRFRGRRGEIDLVAKDGQTTVFVEVKRSKSHASAALRVTQNKIQRLWMTAEEYLARYSLNLETDMRFDVALVDELGRVKIHENAMMA